jgi:hypothetical protein
MLDRSVVHHSSETNGSDRKPGQAAIPAATAAAVGGAPVIGPLWLDITQPPTRTPFPPSTTSPPAFFTAASGAKRGLASEMPIGARRVFHYRCSRRHHCAVYNSPSASTVPPVNFMSALHSCQTKPGLWAPRSPPIALKCAPAAIRMTRGCSCKPNSGGNAIWVSKSAPPAQLAAAAERQDCAVVQPQWAC